MGLLKFLFDINPDDSAVDKVLKVGGSFDWMIPLNDVLQGYNTVECEGWDGDCRRVAKRLKAQGIKCRVQFTGDGWRVISKR